MPRKTKHTEATHPATVLFRKILRLKGLDGNFNAAAAALGMDRGNIAKIWHGKQIPNVETLQRIASPELELTVAPATPETPE